MTEQTPHILGAVNLDLTIDARTLANVSLREVLGGAFLRADGTVATAYRNEHYPDAIGTWTRVESGA